MSDPRMSKLLDNIDADNLPIKSFDDITQMQRELYQHYKGHNEKCNDNEFMCQQMVLAIIDEAAEYYGWVNQNNMVEAMFEAIDLYHFALEGLLILEPHIRKYNPSIIYYADRHIINQCSHVLSNINWKHWKKPMQKEHVEAAHAFMKLCDIAYSMFAQSYIRAYGGGVTDIELIDVKHLEHKFFIFYYAKNRENYNRQRRGY